MKINYVYFFSDLEVASLLFNMFFKRLGSRFSFVCILPVKLQKSLTGTAC
jgi:hypothetical protein